MSTSDARGEHGQQSPRDSRPAHSPHRKHDMPPAARRGRVAVAMAGGLVVGVAVVLGTVAVTTTPAATQPISRHVVADDPVAALQQPVQQAIPARPVTDAELANLPQATTFGTVTDAAPDATPQADTTGIVAHPTASVPVYSAPGGPAIAAAPAQQVFGAPPMPSTPTWLPVIDQQPGWIRVLLPVRPNHATGWLSTQDSGIVTARTPYRIEVDRSSFTLSLYKDDHRVGQWTVGVGKLAQSGPAESITPAGRTFLLGDVQEEHPTYSPVIMPLGAHSDTYTTYGGGPGTVGVHTWLSGGDVYGRNSSDGCVRVPPDALQILSTTVPLGTTVLIK